MSLESCFRSLSITRFLEEVDNHGLFWIVKRLSGNDTNLTGGHQSGLYLPRRFFEVVLPQICSTEEFNPETFIESCYLPQAEILVENVRAIYYNSKFFPEKNLKKKYNEFRLTRWGGRNVPLQDPEKTGSICLLAIQNTNSTVQAVAWVAETIAEEDIIEHWLGEEVEPGSFIMKPAGEPLTKPREEFNIPVEWLTEFPSGKAIFRYIMNLVPRKTWTKSLDKLLLKRREVEFRLFEEIERKQILPSISNGFTSVESFITLAHSVSNRRKSRAGKSLELNLETIFIDERLAFETQVFTENRKKPDFIFPSGKAYHDESFPAVKLQMLASKTCCKDRWRQVLSEADRISPKHLFTLQQGVSSNQLKEMHDNNVSLVIPEPFLKMYPKDWRSSLITLDGFIRHIRTRQETIPDLQRWIN